MTRKKKNIITIIISVLLICSIIVTGYLGINSNDNNLDNNGGMNMQEPPEKSEGGNTNGTEPPEKPDGENTNGDMMMNKSDMKMGDTTSENGNTELTENNDKETTGQNTNGTEPPEKPDGEMSSEKMNDSDMQSFGVKATASIETIYLVLLIVESSFLALTLVYLVLSKFNLLTFKETFANGKDIALYASISIILAALLSYGSVTVCNNLLGNNKLGNDMGNSSNSSKASYSAVNSITESQTISDTEYTSSNEDENALSVSGDIEVTASNITVTKTGDSDGGDNTSFYGTNSAIIAKEGATLNLDNIVVTTDATGANGVFSYGGSATTNNSSSDGTTINISNSKITTSADNSGGIMTTGGGITNATNLEITTAGTSSAAIRSDRGGGTVNVDGGTYKTTGNGSPTIYSTADITVKNATLTSTASEGIVIEGKNSVTIENTNLTDSNTKLNGQSTTYKNIFLYQSMSGDADDGTAEFTAKDSTIVTNNGDSFYVTNTSATISLTNNTITNNDSTGNFLRIQKDSWGNSGSNGGIVTLNMNNQKVTGNVVVDSISTLTMNLTNSSTFKGMINNSNEAKSITLVLDKTSSITLTGDCYVTSLTDADSTYSNINLNGYKLYVNNVILEK